MCGIYGFVNFKEFDNNSLKEKHLKSLDVISHRGPDNSTLKFYNTKTTNEELYNLVLGHNRLSIIDLNSNSNQPFEYEDYVIIFNGEIFNYLELRNELIEDGVSFKTNSDTEVLLKLYIKRGESAFNRLNGMWAFSILDKKTNKLIISRDRFGIKPLYYISTEDKFIFSSEIKQLINHLDTIESDSQNIKDYLSLSLLDHNNKTFFKDIYKLPQSTTRVIDLKTGKHNDNLYWDITNIIPYKKTYLEAVKEYQLLFEEAVKIRLRSDVPIGNTLSGGLDSSSIAVVAKNNTPNLLNFAVVSNKKGVSEEKYVDELIKANNINVKKLSSDTFNPWEKIEEVIYHHDEPILSFSAVNHYNMMKKIKHETNLTVILSGQGGDEGLCGYGKYMIMNIIEKRKTNILQFFQESFYSFPRLIKEFNLNLSKRYFSGFLSQNKNFTFSVEKPRDFSIANTITNRQIADYRKYSVPPLCHYEDRNSMAYALEVRLPFLDYRLVEFSLSLPIAFKLKKGVSKRILRDAIKELPKLISRRKVKMGFNIPEKDYFQMKEAKEFLALVLDEKSFVMRNNYLSKELINKLKQNTFNDKTDYRLFQRIIFLEVWARKFNL